MHMAKIVQIRSFQSFGVMSPYPTVVMVVNAQYKSDTYCSRKSTSSNVSSSRNSWHT